MRTRKLFGAFELMKSEKLLLEGHGALLSLPEPRVRRRCSHQSLPPKQLREANGAADGASMPAARSLRPLPPCGRSRALRPTKRGRRLLWLKSRLPPAYKRASANRGADLGRLMGLEPTTSGITIQHSNQLSYSRHGPIRLARQVGKCQGRAPA